MHSIVQNSIYLIQYIQLDKKTIFDKISCQEVGLQGPMHALLFFNIFLGIQLLLEESIYYLASQDMTTHANRSKAS
jgi:hypothetical protein